MRTIVQKIMRYDRTLLMVRLNIRERRRERERFVSSFNNRIDYAPKSQKRARETLARSLVSESTARAVEVLFRGGFVRTHESVRCLPVFYETRKLVKYVIMLDERGGVGLLKYPSSFFAPSPFGVSLFFFFLFSSSRFVFLPPPRFHVRDSKPAPLSS